VKPTESELPEFLSHGISPRPGGLTLVGNDDRRCVEVVAPEGNVRMRLEVEGWPWYVRFVP
jgi:hypothetical protein